MLRSARLILLLALLPIVLTGCGIVAKQGVAEVLGARARVMPVSDAGMLSLDAIDTLLFSPVTTTLSTRICPSNLTSEYDRAYRDVAKSEKFSKAFPGSGQKVRVATEIVFFEGRGLLGKAQCIARIRLTQGASLLLDALVHSTSKAITRSGADDLADAGATALADYLRKHKD